MIAWIVLLLILAVLFIGWGRRSRAATGVPSGDVLYSDTASWDRLARPLFSERLRLTGKPDYIVHHGREVIPVEVKSSPAPRGGPYDAHIYQVIAYCALIAEKYQVRPSHGLIQYADEAFSVDYTPELERNLTRMLAEMRVAAVSLEVDRSHSQAARCSGCGFEYICEQSLV